MFPQATPQQFVAQGLLEPVVVAPVVVAVSLTGPDGILFHKLIQSHVWPIITRPNASMRSSLCLLQIRSVNNIF